MVRKKSNPQQALQEALLNVRQRLPNLEQFADVALQPGVVAEISSLEAGKLSWYEEPGVVLLNHPIRAYSPAKRLSLDHSTPVIKDNLQGVVGSYLLLSQGVFNMRRAAGREVTIELVKTHDEGEILPTAALVGEQAGGQASLF